MHADAIITRSGDDVARSAASSGASLRAAKHVVAKIAIPVAVAADGGIRIHDAMDVEQQFAAGDISAEDREVAHARSAAGMMGGWIGAWVLAKFGAIGGAEAGIAVAPGPGTLVGTALGGVVGGIVGYFGGEAAAAAAAEWTVKQVHRAGTTIAGCTQFLWKGATTSTRYVAEKIKGAWNWVWGY